jgi:RHS repeat-associated protein
LIGEYDNGGALIAGYTHGPGIDDVISMKRGGDSHYYFKDALGSITSLSDSSETTLNNYEYDAFGSVFSKTELVVNPYGFTGRVLDNESGLMYYRMRYYDPAIGRFITADPIRFQGGINFYTYCLNDPVNLTDPLGLLSCDGTWKRMGSARIAMWYCRCYWLCVPCDGTTPIWDGNYRTLPSTIGTMICQGRGGLESGDTCLCKKPGPEKDCDECP